MNTKSVVALSDPLGNTPEEFGRIIRSDIEKWAGVLKGALIKVN